MEVLLILILDRVVVHQPVDSVARLVEHGLGREATTTLKLLEYRHLVLRVEDVKLAVGGDEAVGKL